MERQVLRASHRLRTITERSAEVTLRFQGVQGATTVPATNPVQHKVSVPETVTSTASNNYYATGDVAPLGGKGLVFATSWVHAPVHSMTTVSHCFWRNRPAQTGHLPNCGSAEVVEPGNLWGGSTDVDPGPSADPSFRIFYGSWFPYESGFRKRGLRYGYSASIETASVVDEIGSLGLWLTYD
jgi:hypothetical protein